MGNVGIIRVGTSGWSYDHWRGVFYPEHLSANKRLAYYAECFRTVEIDSTFYHLPGEHAVDTWRSEVPDDFVFAVKGSRFITHQLRLDHAEEAAARFVTRVSRLAEKLAVVLWQLPPTLPADAALLDRFLGGLPSNDIRHAVEFRHESWLGQDTFAVLRKHNAASVIVSSDVMPECLEVTADFLYLRFHGTAEYHGAYTHPALEPWAEFLTKQARSGTGGYVYFNNDAEGHAPADALRLAEMLGDIAIRPSRE